MKGKEKTKQVKANGLEMVTPEDATKIRLILDRLADGVYGCHIDKGPAVVRMVLSLNPGVKSSQVTKNIPKAMMELDIYPSRIEAPIMGRNLVGIEFPRSDPETITFADVFGKETYAKPAVSRNAKYLPVVFGKDLNGSVIACDLASAPHMLVGGAPGQGASQFLHSVICGLAASRTPDELQFILVDPSYTEFAQYAKLPNLLVPVIKDANKVVFSLHWAVEEMGKRLKMFSEGRARNIVDFNSRDPNAPQCDIWGAGTPAVDLPATMPYIVIVISDFDSGMEKARKEIAHDIQRITAMARPAGIHLILETKLPEKKVLPDSLTANIPVRVAFKTASEKDSKVILGDMGAESLIGGGDALVKSKDGMVLRVQTPFISDVEIDTVVANCTKKAGNKKVANPLSRNDYRTAYEVVVKAQKASTSYLQRKMRIGYTHAASLIDELEVNGVIGPCTGPEPRKVLVDSLPEPQMAEVEMTIKLSFKELKALRLLAEERRCDVDDIASEFVHERLVKKDRV